MKTEKLRTAAILIALLMCAIVLINAVTTETAIDRQIRLTQERIAVTGYTDDQQERR